MKSWPTTINSRRRTSKFWSASASHPTASKGWTDVGSNTWWDSLIFEIYRYEAGLYPGTVPFCRLHRWVPELAKGESTIAGRVLRRRHSWYSHKHSFPWFLRYSRPDKGIQQVQLLPFGNRRHSGRVLRLLSEQKETKRNHQRISGGVAGKDGLEHRANR